MAGPAINIRLHNTKREPAGFCQRPPEPPSPMMGGREEAGTALPTAPRAPAVGGAPGQPTDPQTSTAPPPNRGGGVRNGARRGPPVLGERPRRASGPPGGAPPPRYAPGASPAASRARSPPPVPLGGSWGRSPSPGRPLRSSRNFEAERAEGKGCWAQPPGLAAILGVFAANPPAVGLKSPDAGGG